MSSLTLHHLNNSRSQRILWLLEELQIPYELKRYERDPKTMLAPDSLKRIHPLGKSPVITDGPQTVAESGAIIEYLLSTYGQGRLIPPAGTPERQRFTFWLHYAEGSAMPPLLMALIFGKIETAPMPFLVKPIAKEIVKQVRKSWLSAQLKLHQDYWEAELSRAPWFAGSEFSAADIQMSFPLEASQVRGGGQHKEIKGFLERIHARPAYRRALERGGEYNLSS